MLGSKDRDPAKIRAVGLTKWYDGLGDFNRVKLGRYLEYADASSADTFLVSVAAQAVKDHNYAFAATAARYAAEVLTDPISLFDVNEQLVLALFNLKQYDECDAACEAGLARLTDEAVMAHVKGKKGVLPEALNCRNYKLNVAVGIHYDYDEGNRILDRFLEQGLIDAEEAACRKQSIKIFRLQKTFDGIFALKEKDEPAQ
ncbi:MAG: hypothetical protein PHT00_01855 [Candidatus Methanomethylophilus sp.]|nr:hypothetical protein [Methanomethylophilus sp.]MDD3232899.1 hypothetical protein [Methanomethylophilus sp.]MDD4221828.1 hypothetical protein [Methanomethylophilus sp.]MDD4668502.1 hypothetical protein [Methanomethylophilus sp.]